VRKRTIPKVLIISMILICLLNSTIYADEEMIKRGDKSETVALLQQLLKDKYYFDYDIITGYYGIITEESVKKFQRESGLKADGITGPETWAALLSQDESDGDNVEVVSNEDTDMALSSNQIEYSTGMECADVALIQSRLNDLGFYNYKHITGYFGSITNIAVSAFQKACYITPTGIVDRVTWDLLFDDYVAPALLPGTASENVVPLQKRLAELGYYSFEVDGDYGPKTKEAVKYFQKACGITANGIADTQTQEFLYSETAISEQSARRSFTSTNNENIVSVNIKPRTNDIIEIAKQYLGSPYVYGADGPEAFDCVGFISYIYEMAGISLPKTNYLQEYDNFGTKINDRLSLNQGDLVFFDTISTDGNLADHVGIYIGNGDFIHVDENFGNRVVVIDSLTKDNGWYTARFSWGRRLIN